jgi:hypothetical protein
MCDRKNREQKCTEEAMTKKILLFIRDVAAALII